MSYDLLDVLMETEVEAREDDTRSTLKGGTKGAKARGAKNKSLGMGKR